MNPKSAIANDVIGGSSVPGAESNEVSRDSTRSPTARRLINCCVALLLVAQASLLAWEAYRDSPTWDEPSHFTAGVNVWRTGTFRIFCVNPPLVRTLGTGLAVLFGNPLLPPGPFDSPRDLIERAEFRAGRDTADLNGANFFWLMTLARWGALPFTLLGGWICFLWGRDLYGPASGILALTIWVFEPNVLGHGHLITPDVGAASLSLTSTYFFWHWLKKPTWRLALAAGLILGLAELTKTSLVVLFIIWPGLWVTYRLLSAAPICKALRTGLLQIVVIIVLAVWVLNLGYCFENSFKPLREYGFVSKSLGASERPGTEFDVAGTTFHNPWKNTWLGYLPVPLPESYVLGVDLQKRDLEKSDWSYLRGEWKRGGWWYYYVYAMLVKCPVGLWILVGLALFHSIFSRPSSVSFKDELILLVPAVAVITFVSSQLGFNRHLRYVLPAFPFLIVWASKAIVRPSRHGGRPLIAVCIAATGWLVISSLCVYPHSLSYFNELSGGPLKGYLHLGSSNTDWGQDLLNLKRWMDSHPEARPLHLAYEMPIVNPQMAGVEALAVPKWPSATSDEISGEESLRGGPVPGWYVVSVNKLLASEYAYFRDIPPVGSAGYSLHIFHLTYNDVIRLRMNPRYRGTQGFHKNQTFPLSLPTTSTSLK